jgi:hypothetical protein
MITYMKRPSDGVTVVYLENKKTGEIRAVKGGFQYVPKASRANLKGEILPSLEAVKRSLEGTGED